MKEVEKMKKQYFGKDTKNGLRAIYAVAFTNDISTHTLTWSVTISSRLYLKPV